MTARAVDFYWDAGSTNTYFALKLLEPILQRTGAALRLHPFNLGYVFRAHGYVLMDEPPAKIANRKRDLERWAERHRLAFRFPSTFPIKTSVALRGSIAMRRWDLELPYVRAVLDAYFERDDASIAEFAGLRPIARSLGVDPDAFQAEADSDATRKALADSTDHGLATGVFGAPSLIVGRELFWGKDRMEFVEEALLRG